MTISNVSSVYARTILIIRNIHGHLTYKLRTVTQLSELTSCTQTHLPLVEDRKYFPGWLGKLRKETENSLSLKTSVDAHL